ncbi:hypothetical protein [Asaia sp. VD9]|uniref:hypothetical protein n=1 Tax=Asaia sp. VD9 TaxID=3081235 RepID=UPI003017C4A2
MTWRPSANILRPVYGTSGGACPTARPSLLWPPASLEGGGDYSVDFDGLLAPGEYILSFLFDAGTAADLGWTNLFGTIATAWLRWKASGTRIVTICALTSHGNTHQVEVGIVISARPSLFPVSLPEAPQTPTLVLSSDAMDRWLQTLPTEPLSVSGGWYNNAGIPTRIGGNKAGR